MMICSISGAVLEEPVVSKISGLLFEKRLIEHHISDHGKCPVTGEPLTMNDIIPIKTGNIVNPRPVQDDSIPGMPGMFQNELEQQLHTARQELSHALYKHDFSSSIISKLNECNGVLSQQRKKRVIAPTLAPVDAVERYTQLTVNPLHRTNKPGILSMDILYSKDIIATAGNDSNAIIFDRPSGQVVYALSGHSKKVTSVKFVGDGKLVVTASADKTVRLWQELDDGIYDCAKILKDHKDEVKSVTIHPTNNYFASASLDGTWSFYDLASGLCLTKVDDEDDPSPLSGRGYTSAAFHPDGLILGNGTADAVVKLWDVKSQENVASCPGHRGAVTAISFSENGYFLATAAQDGVRLWDLRKLKNFLYDENTTTQSVEFDYSGSYLALGGSDIRVYQAAKVGSVWNCINIFPELSGTGKITCLKFGSNAKYIAVGSMDGNLRIFGLSEEGEEEASQLMGSLKI